MSNLVPRGLLNAVRLHPFAGWDWGKAGEGPGKGCARGNEILQNFVIRVGVAGGSCKLKSIFRHNHYQIRYEYNRIIHSYTVIHTMFDRYLEWVLQRMIMLYILVSENLSFMFMNKII